MKVSCLSGITRKSGGLFYAVSSLCNGLKNSGLDVSVFGRSDPFLTDDSEKWASVSLVAYNAAGPLGGAIKLGRLLAQADGDVVHQHGIWLGDQWAALRWQKKTKRPVVISPHGMLDPWALKNSAWKKKLAGMLFANESLQKTTCIHALCRSEADSIRAYGLKNPIAIIPNGVELPQIGRQKTEDGGRKKLFFLGRIHPKKGLSELIEAWGREPGAWREEWQLLIAGWDDGNHLAGLKQLASCSGLIWSDMGPSSDLRPPSSDLCFLGPKFGAEKEALLRSVDAFILPSFSEGLPMSVLEAWAYGLPVIMTEFCNLPEGFDAGAAIRVDPESNSISQGLETLAGLPEMELKDMGAKGRDLVEKEFTWSRIADNMRKVYEWCLTGTNPPHCMEFIDE